VVPAFREAGGAGLDWMRGVPHRQERTDIVCHFLFEACEIDKPGFNPADAVEFRDITNRQDWGIWESVQHGIGSRVHHNGYYAPMEDYSLDIRRYVRERLGPELCTR
jgi:glycine betaine catabolism A